MTTLNKAQKEGIAGVLKSAKAYIESGWLKGDYARDVDGNRVDPTSVNATCWCSIGALYAAMKARVGDDEPGVMHECISAVEAQIPGRFSTLYFWQDSPKRTKEEVLMVFQKAIDALEK